jgi:flagellar motor protein MotB
MSSSVLSPVDSSDKIRVNTTNHSDNSPPFFSGPASISNAASTTQSASNAVTDPSIIDGNRYEAFRPIIPNHIVSPPVSTTNPNTVSPVENTIVEKPKITDDSNSAVNETNELKKQITDLEAELKKVKESPPPITPNFSSDNPKELSPETIATTTISDSQKDEQIKIDSSNKENHLPLPHFNVEGITTTKDNNAIRISIVDTLLFMNTSWKLTPDAEELLRRITTEIQAAYSDVEIDVEGHTDNLDVDPKNPTQKHEISTIKAGIVMDYCVKTLKCNPAKMKIIPYGSKRPIENNSTAKGRAKNNRIEIVIIPTNKS